MKIRKSDVPAKPAPKKKPTPDPNKRLFDQLKRTGDEMAAVRKALATVTTDSQAAVQQVVDSIPAPAPPAKPVRRWHFEITRDYRGFIESVDAIPVFDVN